MEDSTVLTLDRMEIPQADTETVTISKQEFEDLTSAALQLQCLQNAGVDNWTWYDDAMKEFHELSQK